MTKKVSIVKKENNIKETGIQIRSEDTPGNLLDRIYIDTRINSIVFDDGQQEHTLNIPLLVSDPSDVSKYKSWINTTDKLLKYVDDNGAIQEIKLNPIKSALSTSKEDYFNQLFRIESGDQLQTQGLVNHLSDAFNNKKYNDKGLFVKDSKIKHTDDTKDALIRNLERSKMAVDYTEGIVSINAQAIAPLTISDNNDGTHTFTFKGDISHLMRTDKRILIYEEDHVYSSVMSPFVEEGGRQDPNPDLVDDRRAYFLLDEENKPSVFSAVSINYDSGDDETELTITDNDLDLSMGFNPTELNSKLRLLPLSHNVFSSTTDDNDKSEMTITSVRALAEKFDLDHNVIGSSLYERLTFGLELELITNIVVKRSKEGRFVVVLLSIKRPSTDNLIKAIYSDDYGKSFQPLSGGVYTNVEPNLKTSWDNTVNENTHAHAIAFAQGNFTLTDDGRLVGFFQQYDDRYNTWTGRVLAGRLYGANPSFGIPKLDRTATDSPVSDDPNLWSENGMLAFENSTAYNYYTRGHALEEGSNIVVFDVGRSTNDDYGMVFHINFDDLSCTSRGYITNGTDYAAFHYEAIMFWECVEGEMMLMWLMKHLNGYNYAVKYRLHDILMAAQSHVRTDPLTGLNMFSSAMINGTINSSKSFMHEYVTTPAFYAWEHKNGVLDLISDERTDLSTLFIRLAYGHTNSMGKYKALIDFDSIPVNVGYYKLNIKKYTTNLTDITTFIVTGAKDTISVPDTSSVAVGNKVVFDEDFTSVYTVDTVIDSTTIKLDSTHGISETETYSIVRIYDDTVTTDLLSPNISAGSSIEEIRNALQSVALPESIYVGGSERYFESEFKRETNRLFRKVFTFNNNLIRYNKTLFKFDYFIKEGFSQKITVQIRDYDGSVLWEHIIDNQEVLLDLSGTYEIPEEIIHEFSDYKNSIWIECTQNTESKDNAWFHWKHKYTELESGDINLFGNTEDGIEIEFRNGFFGEIDLLDSTDGDLINQTASYAETSNTELLSDPILLSSSEADGSIAIPSSWSRVSDGTVIDSYGTSEYYNETNGNDLTKAYIMKTAGTSELSQNVSGLDINKQYLVEVITTDYNILNNDSSLRITIEDSLSDVIKDMNAIFALSGRAVSQADNPFLRKITCLFQPTDTDVNLRIRMQDGDQIQIESISMKEVINVTEATNKSIQILSQGSIAKYLTWESAVETTSLRGYPTGNRSVILNTSMLPDNQNDGLTNGFTSTAGSSIARDSKMFMRDNTLISNLSMRYIVNAEDYKVASMVKIPDVTDFKGLVTTTLNGTVVAKNMNYSTFSKLAQKYVVPTDIQYRSGLVPIRTFIIRASRGSITATAPSGNTNDVYVRCKILGESAGFPDESNVIATSPIKLPITQLHNFGNEKDIPFVFDDVNLTGGQTIFFQLELEGADIEDGSYDSDAFTVRFVAKAGANSGLFENLNNVFSEDAANILQYAVCDFYLFQTHLLHSSGPFVEAVETMAGKPGFLYQTNEATIYPLGDHSSSDIYTGGYRIAPNINTNDNYCQLSEGKTAHINFTIDDSIGKSNLPVLSDWEVTANKKEDYNPHLRFEHNWIPNEKSIKTDEFGNAIETLTDTINGKELYRLDGMTSGASKNRMLYEGVENMPYLTEFSNSVRGITKDDRFINGYKCVPWQQRAWLYTDREMANPYDKDFLWEFELDVDSRDLANDNMMIASSYYSWYLSFNNGNVGDRVNHRYLFLQVNITNSETMNIMSELPISEGYQRLRIVRDNNAVGQKIKMLRNLTKDDENAWEDIGISQDELDHYVQSNNASFGDGSDEYAQSAVDKAGFSLGNGKPSHQYIAFFGYSYNTSHQLFSALGRIYMQVGSAEAPQKDSYANKNSVGQVANYGDLLFGLSLQRFNTVPYRRYAQFHAFVGRRESMINAEVKTPRFVVGYENDTPLGSNKLIEITSEKDSIKDPSNIEGYLFEFKRK